MMKIGILTYFSSINYGAFLQAYSLQRSLQDRYPSMDIEIIDYTTYRSHDMYLMGILDSNIEIQNSKIAQYNAFLQARKELRLSGKRLLSDSISEFEVFIKGMYDIIIVGSDEVWKIDGVRGFPNCYWMNIDLEKTILMAFAISGRSNYKSLDTEGKSYICEAINNFSYIGTRDLVTKKGLEIITGKQLYLNSDPTLLNAAYFKSIAIDKNEIKNRYGISEEKPIASLMLSNNFSVERLTSFLAQDYSVCNLYNTRKSEDIIDLSYVGPFEWINIISASEVVITDYYHGMLFSIIYGCPFIAIEKALDGSGKIEDFLTRNNLSKNLIISSKYEGEGDFVQVIINRIKVVFDTWSSEKIDCIIDSEQSNNESFFYALDVLGGNLCKEDHLYR